ncbi:MAG: hypothetical protein QOG87_3453 [Actinomycetota bacterium]|jgi:ABC-type branched-subunit amino acid transport system substrate-binding protein
MASVHLRRGGSAALLAAVLIAGACGSTVPEAAQRRVAQGGLDGETALDTTGGDSVDELGGSLDPGTAGATGPTGRGAGSSAAGGRAGASGAGGGTVGAAVGPGVTDKEIHVGAGYAVNAGAANAAFGAGGIDQGDDKRNTQIVIDDINAHGGIAGRKVIPEWYELDATSAETTDAQYQGACESLTSDRKVFAVMGGDNETFLRCLHNAKVVAVNHNLTISDMARYKRFPYYFELSALNLDRVASVEVAQLQAQGYFNGGWNTAAGAPALGRAKVGIFTYDLPGFNHAVDQVLVPALGRIGLAPEAGNVVRAPYPQNAADVSGAATAASNAVLKFRSSGVTHVLVFEEDGVLSLLFGNNADSQGYRPRHGVNSQNGTQALVDSGAYPRGQLPGTVGIGWFPGIDVTPAENTDDGPYSNDTRRRCIALYKAAGVSYNNANAAAIALGTCTQFWWLREVMSKVTVFNRDGVLAAANRIGAFESASGQFVLRIDADHHDGVGAVRHWAYQPECGCMRYTSGNITVD